MKIKIKAIDAGNRLQEMYDKRDRQRNQLRPIIDKFMISQGYTRGESSFDGVWRYTKEDEEMTILTVFIDRLNLSKRKATRGDSWNYEPFTKAELRFFDNLGFTIESNCSYYINQIITDWWTNKALDGKTRVELLDEGLRALGYGPMIQMKRFGKNWLHKTEDFHVEYFDADNLRGMDNWNTLLKRDSSSNIIPFTPNELRLLDSLHFELHEDQVKYGKQNIDDWFKALDGKSRFQLLDEGLQALGFDTQIEKPSTGWLWYHKTEDVYLTYYASNRYRGDAKNQSFDKKTVSTQSRIKFTRDELLLFDNLGFRLHPIYSQAPFNQNIDDWFKALDGKSRFQLLDEGLQALGYDESVKRYWGHTWNHKKEDWIITMYSGDNMRGSADNNSLEKTDESENNIKLTRDELMLIDNLEFKLHSDQIKYAEQNVDDWFKAQDAIKNTDDLIEVITSFYNKRWSEGVNQSYGDSTDVLTFKTKISDRFRVIVTVYVQNKIVSKVREDLLDDSDDILKFSDEELKFFDNLGFDLDENQTTYTSQNIDDWFKKKANDAIKTTEDLIDYILEFYNKRWSGEAEQSYADNAAVLIFKRRVSDRFKVAIYVDTVVKRVSKHREDLLQGDDEILRFSPEELRFFDNLGYTLSAEHSISPNKQSIDDWFKKKANDAATMADIKRKLKERYLAQGYEIRFEDTDVIHFIKQHPDNKSIYRFYLKDMTAGFEGLYRGVSVAIKLSNEELKFLDNLGFEISDHDTLITEQTISDWFKAHDADSSEFRIAQYFSNRDGWVFETYGQDKKMVGYYSIDRFTEYVITAYAKDYSHEKLKGTVNKKHRNLVDDKWKYIPMTNEELRFFDGLGFVIYETAADETKQTIDDWFKAQDIDMFKAIDDFIIKKNKGKRIFTDTRGIDYMTSKTTGPRHTYETHLYVDYRNKTVHKYMHTYTRPQMKNDLPRQISEEYRQLTSEELRFFDNLGFEIDEEAGNATMQEISDWFKNKASDAIDLAAVISDFMKKIGYERKRIPLPNNKTVYVKEFYDSKYRETRFNYFTISLREPLTVEKTFTLRDGPGREFYDDFTNNELKFFDNLGFVIDLDQTETLKQKIDDWWIDK